MNCFIYYITAVIISICLFYAYAKYKLSYWSRRGVKSPPTHLIFGNFKECITLKKASSDVLCEIYQSADSDDPYIGFYIFHKPMLLMRNSNVIKQIMIEDFEVFPNRQFGSFNEMDSLYLRSILSIKQPAWKYLKSKLTPALTGNKLKKMIPLIMECNEPMLNFIESLPTDKADRKKYEVKQFSTRYISDITASLFFGVSTYSFNASNNTFWEIGYKHFNLWRSAISYMILFYILEWIYLVKSYIEGYRIHFHKIFWDSMNTREKMGYKRGDLIDTILALKNEEQNPIYRFEDNQLLAQATSFYIASAEATSNAIAFVLHDLATHPEHQAAIYDEIQTHLSGKEIILDLFDKISFLDSVVHESMRLHPSLPITDRIATRNYKLPSTGLIIEKCTAVYLSINAINQDPRYFSNPNDFIPSRKDVKNKKFNGNLTFGVGPRSCIEQRLAIIMIKMAVITILSNYTIYCQTNKNDVLSAIAAFTYSNNNLYIYFKKHDKCVYYN